ncbi:MAG: LCP family protein, partial [bacterium]
MSYPHYQTAARARRPMKRWLVYLLTFLTAFFVLTCAVTFYVWKVAGSQFPVLIWSGDEEPVSTLDSFNVVLAGLDNVDNAQRTDSIMVAHVSIRDKSVGVVSIPRDTRVEIPGHGFEKINGAYPRGEAVLLVKTLERFLGVPIGYYAVLKTGAFARLIDAAGGVDVYVEKDMRYTDRAQNLYINLKKGRQTLDG